MPTPFGTLSRTSRELRRDEVRLCFATSAGCLFAGALGSLVCWWLGETTHLPALLVVGAVYFLMGASRVVGGRLRSPGTEEAAPSGH